MTKSRGGSKRWAVLFAVLAAAGWAAAARAQDPAGGLRGVVRDADVGGTVPAATVRVIEPNLRAETGDDGVFFFPGVAPGTYTVTVTKPGYERAIQSGVAVLPGRMSELEIGLSGEVTEMDEMVVRDIEIRDSATEAGLLQIREASLSMQDAVSGDLLRRAGASDAAGALRLVVGASVEEGKYATVRGLSDRYVGAALNGIRIPSADPKRRAVHMDLFPAGTIKSLSVAKTCAPHLPGDYTGGGVNIETVGIPDAPFFKASFSRENDPLVTGREDFLSYEGSRMDDWARHRGARDMPTGAPEMEANGLITPLTSYHQYKADEAHPHGEQYLTYDELTRSFAPAIGTAEKRAGPNWGGAVSGGDRGRIGDAAWGWMGALNYARKYQMQRGEDTRYVIPPEGSPQEPSVTFDRDVGTDELKYSQMAAAGIGNGEDRQVSVLALRNRVATDRASLRRTQFDPAVDTELSLRQAIQYAERSLDALQFRARQVFVEPGDALFGLKTDAYAARHITEQEEPDVRFFRNVAIRQPDDTWLHMPRPPGFSGAPQDDSTRIWRNTREENTQLGLNVDLPFERWAADPHGWFHQVESGEPTAEGHVRFGLSRDWTQREYRQNSFYYAFAPQIDPTYLGPKRSDFPIGSAGRRAYEAARTAWLAGPEGAAYNQALADAAEDREKGYYSTATPDEKWSDVFLDPGNLGVGPYQDSAYWHIQPRFNDIGYSGVQNLHAGYASIELPLTKQFAITMGSRAENTVMTIDPRSDVDETDPLRAYLVPVKNPVIESDGSTNYFYSIEGVPKDQATAEIRESQWLPAAGASYELMPGMKMRLSWGRTIARPTFLEMAPIITFDFIEGENFIGNRDLRISQVTNYDVRWEWNRGDGEVYAMSWFRKIILDPIEKESFSYDGKNFLLASNYPEGRLRGYELEARRKLGFLPWPGEHLTLNVNYTRMRAYVDVPPFMQDSLDEFGYDRSSRDMEGQPDYLFNAGLTIDFDGWGTSAGLFYNRRGDTLKSGAAVGDTGATPDIYTLSYSTLNFSLTHKLTDHWTIGLKLSNLTEESPVEVYRMPGTKYDTVRRTYVDGVKTSFGVNCSF